MIMIREHGPGLELPAKVPGHGEEAPMKHAQAVGTAEIVRFEIGSGGDAIGGPNGELMRRSVWPGRTDMERTYSRAPRLANLRSKAVRRFWSAPAERSGDGALGEVAQIEKEGMRWPR